MAKEKKPLGRPPDRSKVPLYCRIDAKAVEALDRIAQGMDPQPSRAQLIDKAVREFVENNGDGK